MITYVTRVYCDDCGKYVEFEANLKIIMVGNRRVESSIYSMHGWRTITFDGRRKHFCNECKESAIARYILNGCLMLSKKITKLRMATSGKRGYNYET